MDGVRCLSIGPPESVSVEVPGVKKARRIGQFFNRKESFEQRGLPAQNAPSLERVQLRCGEWLFSPTAWAISSNSSWLTSCSSLPLVLSFSLILTAFSVISSCVSLLPPTRAKFGPVVTRL